MGGFAPFSARNKASLLILPTVIEIFSPLGSLVVKQTQNGMSHSLKINPEGNKHSLIRSHQTCNDGTVSPFTGQGPAVVNVSYQKCE